MTMTPETLQDFYAQLTQHEGKFLFPYIDTVGKVTIGVGRNLTDTGISDDECAILLVNDVNRKVIAQLNKVLPWWVGLDQIRQRVLGDMCFNLGVTTFATFVDFLALVKAGRYFEAGQDMLNTLWAKQVGVRATNLSKMMTTGVEVSP